MNGRAFYDFRTDFRLLHLLNGLGCNRDNSSPFRYDTKLELILNFKHASVKSKPFFEKQIATIFLNKFCHYESNKGIKAYF